MMLRIGAAVGIVAALAFIGSLVWRTSSSAAGEVLHQACSELWIPLALAAAFLACYERFFRRGIATEVSNLAAPAIMKNMPPRQVMESFLEAIYGDNSANRDVIASVLGAHATVSTETAVGMRLSAVNDEEFLLAVTSSYHFRDGVPTDRFVIFATCDTRLRDSVVQLSEYPLFELWFFTTREQFREASSGAARIMQVEIQYVDQSGSHHKVASRELETREVKYRHWARYLPLFREPANDCPGQTAQDHFDDLRIFECSLAELADEAPIHKITDLSFHQQTRQQIGNFFCFWQPPFPCYVDHVSFDVRDFAINDARWEFAAVPFSFRATANSTLWQLADDITSLELRSWLLPGHGVALIWRPAALADGSGDRGGRGK